MLNGVERGGNAWKAHDYLLCHYSIGQAPDNVAGIAIAIGLLNKSKSYKSHIPSEHAFSFRAERGILQ